MDSVLYSAFRIPQSAIGRANFLMDDPLLLAISKIPNQGILNAQIAILSLKRAPFFGNIPTQVLGSVRPQPRLLKLF
jgi:hypothetical protein